MVWLDARFELFWWEMRDWTQLESMGGGGEGQELGILGYMNSLTARGLVTIMM